MSKLKFNVVFNPITRDIAVLFKNKLTQYTFEELTETIGVDNQDDKQSKSNVDIWLDVHLSYDEVMSLEVQKRIGDDFPTDETLAYWSSDGKNKSRKIKIVYTDESFKEQVEKLVGYDVEIGDDVYIL